MNPIDSRVQSLNIRAPDEATWQRVATLVEEAIRTAAMDAELPGRLFVVRQLDVGTIARALSPQNLALAIEAAVERVTSRAVSADDPAAGSAPMIYFKDEANAVLLLAQRVATNKPATEWFWPSVVKGWTPNTPVERALPLLIERAMATSNGVVTLAQVVDALASTGVLDKLLERLSPSDGRALLETIGWTEVMVRAGGVGGGESVAGSSVAGLPVIGPPVAGPSVAGPSVAGPTVNGPSIAEVLAPAVPTRAPVPQLPGHITEQAQMPPQIPMPARTQSLMQRWVERWDGNPHDARAVWLGAMLLVGDRVARSASVELPEMVRQWLAAVAAQTRGEVDDNARNDGAAQAVRRDDLIADARAWLQSHPRSPLDSLFGGGPPHHILSSDSNLDSRVVDHRHADDESVDSSPDDAPTWKKPRLSHHAGFLLLIPLLTRTGVTNIVANDPGLIERDWTTAILLRLARRLGISSDDAAVMWAVTRPVTIARVDRSLTAEVFRAARIRLRMEAGLTMRDVVRRPGTIVASRTTVDVFLHPADVDANLHGAGLGTESDFVPWLARALQFHYLNLNPVDVTA